jgi:hypothetical protein
MAPRFRPVALRPRLSAGLPSKRWPIWANARFDPKTVCSDSNMPKKGTRDKRRNSRNRHPGTAASTRQPDSVKAVLARLSPTLTRVTDQAARQAAWRQWLTAHLPEDLAARLSGIVEREGTLVLFAESAAWSARLRYAMQEIEASLRAAHPGIAEVKIRVLPKS